MHGAFDAWLKDGVAWTAPMLVLAVTEIGRQEDVDEGLRIARNALQLARRDDVHWCEADILRVIGELLHARSPEDQREAIQLLR